MNDTLQDAYNTLSAAFGAQHWWPGESPFEVIVGAILVQNTAWKNVEKAIANLREAGLLTPAALTAVPQDELEELIRPAGYFRVKAARLRNLLDFIVEKYDGSLEAMFAAPFDVLRAELLGVKGVGPETADSILLYAGNMPVFVVDTYTHRVATRHGWIDHEADYHQLQELFHDSLPFDAKLFSEYHALLVRVGHHHCRKIPKCNECPLRGMLPEGGVVEPGW